MKRRNWLIAVCFALMACTPAFSQSIFGSILGTIQDASGGAVAGGEIEIVNLDENTTRKISSNDTGLYQFLNLPPGRYSLSASKMGFAPTRVPEIALEARQERRIDLTLALANVQQTVQVESTAAVINTENATISSTMNNQQIT